MTELAVKLSKIIDAPIERVFSAWLDAESLSRFMLPMPGMPEPRVEADGQQGGRFAIYMQVGDEVIPHTGTYLEVLPHSKIVFSWESPFSIEGSTVTIHFKALSENQTSLDFQHIKFKGEEERIAHEGGWTHILDTLAKIQLQQMSHKATA